MKKMMKLKYNLVMSEISHNEFDTQIKVCGLISEHPKNKGMIQTTPFKVWLPIVFLILLTVLIIGIITPSIIATPPDIPVLLYGKIKYENNLPAMGIGVRVIWTDTSQNTNSRVSRTMNINEAESLSKPELLGVYKFEIYDYEKGSEIKIESGKKSTSLTPTPGILTRAQDIIIALPNSSSKSNNSLLDNFKPFLSMFNYLFNIINNKNKVPEIQSLDDLKDLKDFEEYQNNESPITNTSKQSEPEPNIEINKDSESKKSNNEDNINSGSIDLNGSSGIHDNSPPPEPIRGDSSFSVYRSEFNSSPNIVYNVTDKKVTLFNIINDKDNLSLILIISIISLLIGILLMIILIIIKHIKPILKKLGILSVSIKNLENIESNRFLSKSKNRLKSNESIIEAVELFSTKNINILPILTNNKQVIGTISKYDIITKINNPKYDELQKMKISSIINKNYTSCSKNQSLGDIYTIMIENDLNEVIIKDKDKFVGTIDFFNILNLLSDANFTIENPPKISNAMSTTVQTIKHNEKIFKLRDKLINENSDYAIVMKNNLPAGIVTLKDLMIAIKKNLDFYLNTVEQIMSVNIISMTPGSQVYNAFKIMIEKRFNQIPIIESEKVIGVVNIKFLVKMYYDFLSEIKKRLKKNPNSAIELKED
ncbi:CBS domain-containing protein [Candidatus Pacearchaeota archaeon]|nr:CBS domain-containing protein [Candidatus Pacearchaeota archaeon]